MNIFTRHEYGTISYYKYANLLRNYTSYVTKNKGRMQCCVGGHVLIRMQEAENKIRPKINNRLVTFRLKLVQHNLVHHYSWFYNRRKFIHLCIKKKNTIIKVLK